MERVVALVDMDCFYVQVEQRYNPSLKGKPCAVVQYNPWKGGGIIAVSYEARAFGVTRQMRGDDAKAKCPAINLVRVPQVRGKADLTKYREGGAEVIEVLSRFSDCVERASVDEAYIDLTDEVNKRMVNLGQRPVSLGDLPNTHVVGHDKDKDGKDQSDWLGQAFDPDCLEVHDQRLAVGAVIAEEMRAAVFEDTGFRCSAGIAHNKILSKLACGFHKPNKQTILPHSEVQNLFITLPIRKIRSLGGKLGVQVMEHLQVENMADLVPFSEKALQQFLGEKNGTWLYNMCRGFDNEPVSARQLPKSVGCSKNFTGKNCLDTGEKVNFWLSELAKEVEERLKKDKQNNKRTARTLTLSVRYEAKPKPQSASRVCALMRYDALKFTEDAFALVKQFNSCPPHQAAWYPPIICLGLSAGKFQDDNSCSTTTIGDMFARTEKMASQTTQGTGPELLSSQAINVDQPSQNSCMSQVCDFDFASQKSSFKKAYSDHGNINNFFKTVNQKDSTENCELFVESKCSTGIVDTPGSDQADTEISCVSDKKINNKCTSDSSNSIKSFFKRKQLGLSIALQPCGDDIKQKSNVEKLKTNETGTQRNKYLFSENSHDKSITSQQADIGESVVTILDDCDGIGLTNSLTDTLGADNCDRFKASSTYCDRVEAGLTNGDGVEAGLTNGVAAGLTNGDGVEAGLTNGDGVAAGLTNGDGVAAGLTYGDRFKASSTYFDRVTAGLTNDDRVTAGLSYGDRVAAGLTNRNGVTAGLTNADRVAAGLTNDYGVAAGLTNVSVCDDDYVQCEKCSMKISVWEMPEHMDFHFALELQKDLNTSDRLVLPSKTNVQNNGKRKSDQASQNATKKTKRTSNAANQGKLDSFFVKHN
ncbi:DNA polymerase eta-like isoform X1 [Mya arenaria]|uniref:DNA polymerase eta-like isoform X1 n=1 Tax=Mya arenaria TaxID=6604 RepID=UPI0022E3F474|nr:DNA polymerase eta-like isoform X1 [Mya arenaria]